MRHWAYNAFDCVVTRRVHDEIARFFTVTSDNEDPIAARNAATSYAFVRAMQGPALDMMMRGVAVQPIVRQEETERYTAIRDRAQALLDRLAMAVWDIGLNADSPKQMLAFFNDALACPVEYEVRKTAAGTVRTPTANGKALRKWSDRVTKGPGINPRDRTIPYVHYARPFVKLILTIREASKMLLVLKTALDPDGRMRCSYNPAGTENARWSSSTNVFGRGTNLQNITPTMRRMFCSDDGHWFISTDLEQAESRLVAGLVWAATGDRAYWDACLSGDLHTTVCRMAWPEMGWTGDKAHDRAIADRPYPGLATAGRGFSYRDVAKRIGHGSNYRGSAYGIAMAVGIPVNIVEDFQRRYFLAFPAIPRWHQHIITEIQTKQYLDTPIGRRRYFFGRATDDATIREAIAYIPQSTIGELLNLAMYRTWLRTLLPKTHPKHLPIQLLLQNHDAFAFQVHESQDLPTILDQVKQEMEIPIPLVHEGQWDSIIIPGEFITGWNWAYADDMDAPREEWKFADGNPDGLRKWRGREPRTRRQRQRATFGHWLDRPIRGIHEGRDVARHLP